MNPTQLLKNFKQKFDPLLKDYFDEKLRKIGKTDPTAKEAVGLIRDYTMAGGKRIRPAFLYYAYLATGGKDSDEILKIGMAVELLHSFLLIHDDIIDKDKSRHGTNTIHERYKKIASKYDAAKDRNHFGNSMAIIAGDLALGMTCDIASNNNFPSGILLKVFDKIQKIIFMTGSGEMMDIVMSYEKKVTEKQILEMHEQKTAHYTFEGPIHLGCILSEAPSKYFNLFSKYALPLGKAFQIKDDILGIFGSEKETGKAIGSDIVEGKKTLLVLKALEKGNKEQRKIIKQCLDKKNISKKEIEEFRKVIRETGSLAYSESLAKSFGGESLNALVKIDFKDDQAKEFFTNIVDYIVNRKV